MKSGNPTSGIGETHISRTLDTTIPDPNKGQGGIVIVEERKIYASGFGAYNLADTGEVTMTLSARSSDAHHVPVICIQGNVIDRSEHAGANGAGWKTDISYTLEWWTMKTYALKIRGGADVDKNGKKAGKGPLVAEDISHTIGTVQDQYIFAPIVYAAGFDLEELNGHSPNVVYCMETFHANVAIDKAGALRARDYKDPPIIIWESRESEAAKSGNMS